jgi:hypothetical protein
MSASLGTIEAGQEDGENVRKEGEGRTYLLFLLWEACDVARSTTAFQK